MEVLAFDIWWCSEVDFFIVTVLIFLKNTLLNAKSFCYAQDESQIELNIFLVKVFGLEKFKIDLQGGLTAGHRVTGRKQVKNTPLEG